MKAPNVLVITGASIGIGAASAARFLQAGWRILNLSRRPSPLKEVINLKVDLSARDWVQTCQEQLLSELEGSERICLIHNAARFDKDSLSDLDAEAMRAVLEVNVVAPQRLNRLLLPHMKPGSSILYVGSTLSEKAVAGTFSYVISKHAQLGMMRATSQDLQGTGIHTAAICPGFTDTEMLQKHLNGDAGALEFVKGMSGFGRLINPEEIANCLFFAATNPVLSGAVIHANLGQIEH